MSFSIVFTDWAGGTSTVATALASTALASTGEAHRHAETLAAVEPLAADRPQWVEILHLGSPIAGGPVTDFGGIAWVESPAAIDQAGVAAA